MASLEFEGSEWTFSVPRPFAALYLARLGSGTDEERSDALFDYLRHVLSPEAFLQLEERALDAADEFDIEDVAGLIEAVQQEYSSRPFHVDVSLAATAVANWPAVRGKLVLAGVADPLRDLPNVYALIDAVEVMVLDSMQKEEERDRYFVRMYSPPAGSLASGKVPKGWSREDEMAALDQFS